MRTFTIVIFVKPGQPDEFDSQNWPLHLTILPSFRTEMPLEELLNLTREVCEGIKGPIKVHGIGRENFGPKHNMPATELDYPDTLMNLHHDLVRMYDRGVTYVEEDCPTYRPYVADQGDDELEVGKELSLWYASLIEELPDGRRRVINDFAIYDEA